MQEGGAGADPAIVESEKFRLAHKLCNTCLVNGDCVDELVDAMDTTCEGVLSTRPSSMAGVAAKLRAIMLYHRDDDGVPIKALTIALADLERIIDSAA